MDRGRAPNFKKLAEMGSFMPLAHDHAGPQPGGLVELHHRHDPGRPRDRRFHRPRPEDLHAGLLHLREHRAGSHPRRRRHPPARQGGGPVNLRQGKPFWAYLTEQGIPAWISKVPTNFPVDETATKAIAGMGTPDLIDSYGSFSYYTSDPFEHYSGISGGIVQYVEVNQNVVRSRAPRARSTHC